VEKQKEEVIEEEDENKAIGANEICSDFLKYIKIFIAAICKNYDDLIGGDSSKNQAAKREKCSMINNVKKEERDHNINRFLAKFIAKRKIRKKVNLKKEKKMVKKK